MSIVPLFSSLIYSPKKQVSYFRVPCGMDGLLIYNNLANSFKNCLLGGIPQLYLRYQMFSKVININVQKSYCKSNQLFNCLILYLHKMKTEECILIYDS